MASSPSLGNIFEYYIPKSRTGTAGSSGPTPVPTPSSTGGKPKYAKPWKFIKGNFSVTSNAPFGNKNAIGGKHHVIQDVEIVGAALECGYGRSSKWTSALALNPHEATDLANYLLKRLEMVAACIEVDGNQARVPRSFYSRVEASEKVALSFIIGGIGAYLAARKWLEAGGDSVASFLHVGIYTKGVNGASPLVHFFMASGKSPDYLVESRQGDWHVFESKGGASAGRWGRIVEGLVQLSDVPNIGWAGHALKSPTTCVCVHTSVDSGKHLHVTAVDPPGEGDTSDDSSSLVLIKGVCSLLLILETVEQYRALAESRAEQEGIQEVDWETSVSSRFGGLVVGIPKRYIRYEQIVRRYLAVYLAVSEVLDSQTFAELIDNKQDSLAHLVRERLKSQAGNDRTLHLPQRWLGRKLNRIANEYGRQDFLYRCAKHLKLDLISERLMPSTTDKVILRVTQNQPYLLTSGGMFLQQSPRRAPESEESVAPSATRG
ncbi:hypothetical protein BJN34_04655 [Cupriavidus necator]|uniref:Uncharacterized protein n=1 Tax=Cupriavidus necator TaxID=106590 RepID=A0A1U9UL79_CUPNE|nr:hypothetical protein [Cupriavidus necator]AQV93187.1 hypothetical protein BJN34_04655 [Cupriavidus necator]